jgi:hypothetical protein
LASSSSRKWRCATAALTPRRRARDVFFVLADFRAVFFEVAWVEDGLRAAPRAAFDAERVPVPVLRAVFVAPRVVPRLPATVFLLVDVFADVFLVDFLLLDVLLLDLWLLDVWSVDFLRAVFVRVDFAPAALRVARFRAGSDAREEVLARLRVVRAVVRVFFEGVLLRFVVFMTASGGVRGSRTAVR